MNQQNNQQQLAAFDSLLAELLQAAADPKTTATSFFRQVRSVVGSILAPQAMVVVALGPQRTLLMIDRAEVTVERIGEWVELSKTRTHADDFPGPTDSQVETITAIRLLPRQPSIAVAAITIRSVVWGWMIAEMKSHVLPVQNDILAAISEIVAEFLSSQATNRQSNTQSQSRQYAQQVHSSLNSQRIAQTIADEGRLLMKCDRVSVYVRRGSRLKLLAVTAVANFDTRTAVLKSQQALVQSALRLGIPIGSDKPSADTQVARQMDAYQQQSNYPFLFGVPLEDHRVDVDQLAASRSVRRTGTAPTRSPIGFLLCESTNDINRVEFANGITAALPPSTLALGNALTHEATPFKNWTRWLGYRQVLRISKAAITAVLVGLLIAALFLIKTDFVVRVEGELRPVEQQSVFAPQDGIVDQVLVKSGDSVTQGQSLLMMRSPELELAVTKTIGEIEKLKTLVSAKRIALNQASSDPNASAAVIGQLSSDVSDSEYRMKSAEEELNFLQEQRQELELISPLAGMVLTWQIEKLLMNKPVRWGDSLVTVADESGEWELRFLVPERRIGYLQEARNSGAGEKLEYFFASNPANKFATRVGEIGASTEIDVAQGPVVMVNCAAAKGDYLYRHGAQVIADIDCGRRSIGFVWLHELVDAVRRKFIF